jgi:hypothetical protein
MIPHLRRAFNAAFSDERYREYCRRLEIVTRTSISFRLAESPIFLPEPLRKKLLAAVPEILAQIDTPEQRKASLEAVPPDFDVPGCDEHPSFAQFDFAVTRDGDREDGELLPKLIELQAFPSLYGFQVAQAAESKRYCPDGERLHFLFDPPDEATYWRLLGDAILGGHPPENVVLVDLDPPTQKTVPDFRVTEDRFGIRSICPTKIEKRGRELWYDRDGRKTRILRIYNRLIHDELLSKRVELPFSITDPLDVEWANHPNWYFRWSKHSLPAIRHSAVPEARFLSDFDRWPDDLENWVFKPLFSFAGTGVKVDVTKADLDAVPDELRRQSLLMRKIRYAPAIETVDGTFSKCEIRMMLVWHDGRAVPLMPLVRLSQGKMMGVDFNKNRTWVGSAAGLWE